MALIDVVLRSYGALALAFASAHSSGTTSNIENACDASAKSAANSSPRRTSPRHASPQNVRPRLTLLRPDAAPPHARPRRPHALPARRPHRVCRQAQRTPTELEEYLVAKFSGADPGATGLLSTGAMRDVLQARWQLSLTSP